MRKLFYVRHGFRQQTEKLEFGGQGPQPMRYELWVVIAHPLGPSTITVMKIVIWRTKAFPFGEGFGPPNSNLTAPTALM